MTGGRSYILILPSHLVLRLSRKTWEQEDLSTTETCLVTPFPTSNKQSDAGNCVEEILFGQLMVLYLSAL